MKPFRISKKVASGAVAILLVSVSAFGPLSFVPAPKAHAQLGAIAAFEVNPAIIAGVTATAVANTSQAGGFAPKNILDALAWSIAKMTIQSITRSTVNWINSGFQGSPAFVSDLQSNLKYLGDAVAENFFTNLNQLTVDTTGFNLKSPFQDQINQQLRQEYYKTTGSWGLSYTLNQTSKDPKAFINGDFSKGGFNAFFSASQNPGNNPFGAYTLASNQLFAQIDAAAQQRKAELGWGKGFLPWRGGCATTASGATASTATLSQAEKCPFNAVRTPGSVIESQLENNLGTGIRQLELADSINEIVAALMGQLVNQVLGSGGLLGTSQPSAGGGSSFINQATDPSQYNAVNSSLATGVSQNITNDTTSLTTFRDNWQKILDAANAAQTTCGVRPDITSVITQATAGVAKGNAALQQIGKIQTEVQNAAATTAVDKSTQITTSLSDYQSFLGSATVPNAADQSTATLESRDTSTDPAATPSLYTQMTKLQTTCKAI